MHVFVSSVIRGMEPFRSAAREAAETLRCTVLVSEDFGARPESSQVACLSGVRDCDAVVLLLGARYGTLQPSGFSATHEEYLEARERCPVLAFVQEVQDFEADQRAFIKDVEGWAGGIATDRFRDVADLRVKVTRAIHDLQLRAASEPADSEAAMQRGELWIPQNAPGGGPSLVLIVCPTAPETILRPSALEAATFRRDLKREAVYGPIPVFDEDVGVKDAIQDGCLLLEQADRASLLLAPDGAMRLVIPAFNADPKQRVTFPVVIEEDVQERIVRGTRFLASVVDRVDPTERIREVVLQAAIVGSAFQPWRTRADHARSPNSFTLRSTGGSSVRVSLSPPMVVRAQLRQRPDGIAEDLTALLRRRMSP